MKRRAFIKTGGTAGLAAGCVGLGQSCSKEIDYLSSQPEVALLQTLENEYLKVAITSDAVFDILDKVTGMRWHTSRVVIQDYGVIEEDFVWNRTEREYVEQYPGRFTGIRQGDNLTFTLLSRNQMIMGKFTCSIKLQQKFLQVTILEIDESIPSLMFPGPIFCSQVIIPDGAGRILNPSESSLFDRKFFVPHLSLNMQCFGGVKDDHAWLGVFDEDVVDFGVMAVNGLAYPCWTRTLGKWKGKYSVRYCFLKGDYVSLAQTYRAILEQQGRIKTLDEKTAENGLLARMKGGRTLSYFEAWPGMRTSTLEDMMFKPEHMDNTIREFTVDFTHEEVQRSVKYIQGLGFQKGIVVVRGWIDNGYDGSHPDIWPPDKRIGSIAALRSLLANDQQMVYSLHDECMSMYEGRPSFPKGVIKKPTQELIPGGVWTGGQTYILNSDYSLAYARRNWEHVKTLNPLAYYCDTTAISRLKQSYDKEHPETKLQDKRGKASLLKFFKSQGLLVGSEEGSEFAIPLCDWFESRHKRREDGETIPFWYLVFHDCAYMSRYLSFDRTTPYPSWLCDLLWGTQLHCIIPPSFGNIRPNYTIKTPGFGATRFTEEEFISTRVVDEWHDRVGNAAMTGHKFLNPEKTVEETNWSTGDSIVVNFSDQPVRIDDGIIGAHQFRIRG
jgi:hypothetical protein